MRKSLKIFQEIKVVCHVQKIKRSSVSKNNHSDSFQQLLFTWLQGKSTVEPYLDQFIQLVLT